MGKAQQKDDGSYENWQEIKAHAVNELHLYTCHEADTERVNQLWEWSAIGHNELDTIKSALRPDCLAEYKLAEAHGSMPEDVGEADELALGDLENYDSKLHVL